MTAAALPLNRIRYPDVVASEYSTGMIRAGTLAVPRRTPVLAAKACVGATCDLAG
ncbi:MAG TPA: hypothetical protein VGL39_20975 [Jatrophihabitantaceae bacterium]|jgi:hypothetical protein